MTIRKKTNKPYPGGNGDVIYRSGNPGYKSNSIVFVSKGHTSDDQTQGYELEFEGFQIRGADTNGECLQKNAVQGKGPTQKLKFGSTTILTCKSAEKTSEQDFETYCNSQLDIELFDQIISRFKYLAIFGNPNVNYGKDWVKVI